MTEINQKVQTSNSIQLREQQTTVSKAKRIAMKLIKVLNEKKLPVNLIKFLLLQNYLENGKDFLKDSTTLNVINLLNKSKWENYNINKTIANKNLKMLAEFMLKQHPSDRMKKKKKKQKLARYQQSLSYFILKIKTIKKLPGTRTRWVYMPRKHLYVPIKQRIGAKNFYAEKTAKRVARKIKHLNGYSREIKGVQVNLIYLNGNKIKQFKLPKRTVGDLSQGLYKLRKVFRKKSKTLKVKKKNKKIRYSMGGVLRLNAKKKNIFITVCDRTTNKVRTAFTTRMLYKTKYGLASFRQSDVRHGKHTRTSVYKPKEEKEKMMERMNVMIKSKKFLSKVMVQLFWHLTHNYNIKLLDIEINSNSKKKVRKALSLFRKKGEGRGYFFGFIRSISFVKRKIHGQMRPKKARRL